MRSSISTSDVSRWTLAHALAKGEEYLFDYLAYPFMLYAGGGAVASLLAGNPVSATVGYWTGFAILLAVSASVNVGYVLAYDRAGQDWFGFEHLRKTRPTRPRSTEILRTPLRWVFFCYLSIWHNPLFATLWARSRATPYQMLRADWALFALALALANLGWAGCIAVGAWLMHGLYEVWRA